MSAIDVNDDTILRLVIQLGKLLHLVSPTHNLTSHQQDIIQNGS